MQSLQYTAQYITYVHTLIYEDGGPIVFPDRLIRFNTVQAARLHNESTLIGAPPDSSSWHGQDSDSELCHDAESVFLAVVAPQKY